MAMPVEEFVKQLEDSGILSGDTLKDFLPPKSEAKDAEELARELVKQKKLTKFQAEQVYKGKGKSLVLGNYLLMEMIGAGGMGQVFKARHRRMDRLVAVKLLSPKLTKNKEAIARFEREVKAAAKLRHPNIVAADDADQANGVHFLVMELVEGSDLSALVKKNGPFNVDQAVNYITQAARGLEAAHAEGIVHRDIKPANLLLDKRETVKILDMGLVRIEGGVDAPTQAELTSTGTVMGTVDYMAPEQALNTKTADARADIYSLGCSLFYLLCGKATYDGDSLMAKLLNHREQPIPSLRAARPEVSELLDSVFVKMVAKKVEDRYQTMTEVIADLERCRNFNEQTITIQQPLSHEASSSSTTNPSLSNFLTELSQSTTEEVTVKVTPKPKAGRGNNRLKLIAAGVLGGLILLFGIIIKLKTKEGKLIVEVNEPGAVVQVLDEEGKVQITRKNEQGTITLSVVPGKHQLKVEKEGFKVITKDFEIETNGKKTITAKLVRVKDKPSEATTAKPVTPSAVTPAPPTIAGTPVVTPMPGVMIPAEALTFGGHRYLLVESFGTWAEAKAKADGMGGHLATINSQAERDWIRQSVMDAGSKKGSKSMFLGGLHSNGVWTWITGEPFDPSLWLGPIKSYPDDGLVWMVTQASWAPIPTKDIQARHAHFLIEWDTLGPSVVAAQSNIPARAVAPFDAAQAKKHQTAWAKHLGVPVEYTNSLGMKFVLIPPGEFTMGSTTAEIEAALKDVDPNDKVWQECIKSEAPQHKVILTQPIYLGVHEVTQAEYEQVMGTNPSHFTPMGMGKDLVAGMDTTSHPVETVSWNDAAEFCAKLIQQEKLKPFYFRAGETITPLDGTGYRLPTEAEWECACRAGTSTKYWIGDKDEELVRAGWFGMNSGGRTHAAEELKANPFGLSDIHGNVFEWVQDWWEPTYYGEFQEKPALDPNGPSSAGSLRVVRGGNWGVTASVCRASDRYARDPAYRHGDIGFRVSLVVDAVKARIAAVTPLPTALSTKLFMHDPAFPQWVKDVQAMPAEKQLEAVSKKLMELNPGFDGKFGFDIESGQLRGNPKVESGAVTQLSLMIDRLTDLSPLRAFAQLKSLFGWTTDYKSDLRDLSPLTGLPLTELVFLSPKLTDLTPLKGMRLTKLAVRGCAVTDLAPLKGMPLTTLDCDGMKTTDLSPLQGMPLQTLDINHTLATDFTPLKGMPLDTLYASFTKMGDLSVLHKMPLTTLEIPGCPNISDLSPLKELPLKYLGVDFKPERDADILRSIKTLERINNKPAAEFWKEVEDQKKEQK